VTFPWVEPPACPVRFRPTGDGLGWRVEVGDTAQVLGEVVMTVEGLPRFWPHADPVPPDALRAIERFCREHTEPPEPLPIRSVEVPDPTLKAPWE